MSTLMKFLQIHSAVHAGDLIAVAVEHNGRPHEDFAEAALLGLAPARMVDVGIDVRVETVLAGCIAIPRGGRLFFLEADFHQRLDALITVFPRDDHAKRRAVLRRKSLAVHPDAKKRERVHGLVKTKTFDVGKIDAAVLSLGHLAGVIESLEGDVACFRRRLDELCEDAEGETDPRHNDGPAFDATMAVDAFFEWSEFQDFVYGELAWLGDVTFNGNVPR